MVLQEKRIVVSCPICGRTATVQSEYIQQQLACGHCHGQFLVEGRAKGFCAVKSASDDVPRPTVFIVEHRDEVFSRIATDVAEAGYPNLALRFTNISIRSIDGSTSARRGDDGLPRQSVPVVGFDCHSVEDCRENRQTMQGRRW